MAYRDADLAIRRWYEVATLESVQRTAEGVVQDLILRLDAAAAGTAIPGSVLFSASGAISGTIHLVRLHELPIEVLAQIARVWYAGLVCTAAQDLYASFSAGSSVASVPSTTAQAVTASSS